MPARHGPQGRAWAWYSRYPTATSVYGGSDPLPVRSGAPSPPTTTRPDLIPIDSPRAVAETAQFRLTSATPSRTMVAPGGPSLLAVQYFWATSRKDRNRLVHALHGNGPPTAPGPRRPPPRGGSGPLPPMPRLQARQLQDLQLAETLRSDGWTLPNTVAAKTPIRVYDVRLETGWMRGLAAEIRGPDAPQNLVVVGGDFLSAPTIDDEEALQQRRARRWGPAQGPCHIFVPPRPHLQAMVERIHLQVEVEDTETLFSVCCVIPRDKCPADLNADALRRLVPQANVLFDDSRLEVRGTAVGERAPLIRVPADVRQLPPPQWEEAFLPRNKILLVLSFRRTAQAVSPVGGWIRGHLPDPEPRTLELLRVEFELPAALRQRHALQETNKALRRAAGAVGIAFGSAHRLQQVQVTHSSVLALMAVPRPEARQWLRASGCGNLFVRPFYTQDTAPELERSRFNMLWLRGHRASASRLWESVHDIQGVYGLVVTDKDAAIRVLGEADRPSIEAHVHLVLGDRKTTLHQATPDLRWWRLGPLEDADVFRIQELITLTGLTPHRGEVRLGSAGPFRRVAFFAATGTPKKTSLDDGSWGRSCAARLTPAAPPPRQPRGQPSPGQFRGQPPDTRSAAPAGGVRPGPALAPTSS
eukprot:EG_transcript_3634